MTARKPRREEEKGEYKPGLSMMQEQRRNHIKVEQQ
jgi:hypothetical protein